MHAYRKKRWNTLEKWMPFIFVLPSIILIAVFVYGFIGWTFAVSLTKWNSLVPNWSWAGFKNYLYLLQDYRFQSDLRNTFFFTALFITSTVLIGFIIAVLIDQKIRFENVFRNIFLYPMALSFIVTGVVWQWLLNPSTGINLILKTIGLEHLPKWYTDGRILLPVHIGSIEFGLPVALIAVVAAAVWQMSGFALAMYLAALRGISDDLKEAARVDGATEWQIYTKVIIPQLYPITAGLVIILAHISLKIFDLIYAMTGPGSNFVTDMPGVYMFETTFRGNFYARGSAIAIIMLILVAIFIIPYLLTGRKEARS